MSADATPRRFSRSAALARFLLSAALSTALFAMASVPAEALTIGASVSAGSFTPGSSVTISLELGLAPGETLSALQASFVLVGISSVSAPVLSYDPDGLFDPTGVFGNLAGEALTISFTRSNSDAGGMLAQISFTVMQDVPFHVILASATAARDIATAPFLENVATTPFAGTPLLTIGAPNPIDALEDFEGLPLQSDTTGSLVQGARVYSAGDAGGSVASAEGALAAGTGIASEPGNLFWTLSSAAGDTTASSGFLLIGDLPAMDGGVLSGPYANALAGPTDLVATRLDAQIRSPQGAGATRVRALLMDALGREVATPLLALTPNFQTFSFRIHEDFDTLLGGAAGFDFTQVTGVALEFHSTQQNAPAYQFDVDQITLPEPAANQQAAGALLALVTLALWCRPTRSRAVRSQYGSGPESSS